MSRLGQVALTINGELCPPGESRSEQVGILNRVFELEGGPATGLPWATQHESAAAVICEASIYLLDLAKKLGVQDEVVERIATRVDELVGWHVPPDG